MQIDFTAEQLADPAMASSAEELSACLQCDYCLGKCPTYEILHDEYESPRGRIFLIKQMLESGGPPAEKTVGHIDRCLSCLACMSTCPSSVNYMRLVDHARDHIERHYRRPLPDRLLRWLLAQTLPYPGRLRLAMRAARLARPLANLLPGRIRSIAAYASGLAPAPAADGEARVFPAEGERKRRVALLAGCAQKALNSDINEATIRVLRRHGCEVVIPPGAGCCGALTYHMGRTAQSLDLAAGNIRAWMKEVGGEGLDAIVINTSGCGTVVKEYGFMFRNDALAEDAAKISGLARDICEILSELRLDFRATPGLRVAYHATCSLQFGQRIRFTPKKLLKAAGFTVLEARESHMCCGSAATYNLLQPDISDRLKERKVRALEALAPDAIAAGNIGCMAQIASGAAVPVVHTVELLDWATGGPAPAAMDSATKAPVAAE